MKDADTAESHTEVHMSSLLMHGENLIPISLYYKIIKNKAGYEAVKVIPEDIALKLLADEETKDEISVLNTKWRPQTWQANQTLLQRSYVYNPESGKKDIDWNVFRDARLKACLVDWDLQDDGVDVPVTESTINLLHWTVADHLDMLYGKATDLTEEEAGN